MFSRVGVAAKRLVSLPRADLERNGLRFMSVVNLSDFDATETFLQLNRKSVLYFTASWCPPCKVIKPVFDEMSLKYKEIAFGKIDVDDNGDSATEFQIQAVPTFIFLDGEDVVERFSGADRDQLESLLSSLNDK